MGLSKVDPAKLKKVLKEGGKRGVEIEGASDMGGLEFFCNSVDEPEGDLDLLVESVNAMNAECKPDDEERKGGAGKVGKMVFSSGVDQLAIVCHVPESKTEKIKASAWMAVVAEGLGGEVVKGEEELATAIVKTDKEAGRFPLKMKDEGIQKSIAHLKAQGLFPDADSESEDEYVFGDDDFPQ